MPRDITPKMRAFAHAYLTNGRNGSQAYRTAYGSQAQPGTVANEARRLLRDPRIAEIVNAGKARVARRTERAFERYAVSVEHVTGELARIAFANMGDYLTVDKEGNAHFDATGLTEDQWAAISEITVEEFMDGKGEGARQVRRTKFKLHPKRDALVDLGKHLGMFEDDGRRGIQSETAEARQFREDLKKMFAQAIESNGAMKSLMYKAVDAAGAPGERPVIDVTPEVSGPAQPAPAKKSLADLKL